MTDDQCQVGASIFIFVTQSPVVMPTTPVKRINTSVFVYGALSDFIQISSGEICKHHTGLSLTTLGGDGV